jgi:hypothetical protein
MSHSSFIKVRSVLGRALDYAQRRQLVTSNIARIVEPPAEAERPEQCRSMTPEQARARQQTHPAADARSSNDRLTNDRFCQQHFDQRSTAGVVPMSRPDIAGDHSAAAGRLG